MKKLIYAAVISLAIVSCKKESNDFATLSGTITNKNSDSLVISNPQLGFNRVIKLDENGSFKDTMKIKDGFYRAFDGKEYASLYLKNGADITITLDAKEFDETIKFAGKGANESTFLAKSALAQEEFFKDFDGLLTLPNEEYNSKITGYINDFNTRLNVATLDSAFVSGQKKNIEMMQEQLGKMREQKMYIATKLGKGTTSPIFENYENFKGGTTSLADLKGKYVYIDLWATWCTPCKREIPYLKKVEEQFHDKNIEFVSISIDQKKDYETWKKMVTDKELTGVQLFADNDWKSQFVQDYKVSGIPRFILLDKDGNIVDADAPRPSNPKLVEVLNSLNM